MASRKPLVLVNGRRQQLQAGDALAGAGGTITKGFAIDGGGGTPATGVLGYFAAPVAATIVGVVILADVSGSAVFDVWKTAWGSLPTVANTITASAKPTLSSAVMSRDRTLTGWTTSVAADDVIGVKLESVSGLGRVTIQLLLQAT